MPKGARIVIKHIEQNQPGSGRRKKVRPHNKLSMVAREELAWRKEFCMCLMMGKK